MHRHRFGIDMFYAAAYRGLATRRRYQASPTRPVAQDMAALLFISSNKLLF